MSPNPHDSDFEYEQEARNLIKLQQPREAIRILREGLQLYPGSLGLLEAIIEIYRSRGDFDNSVAYAKQYSDHHPGSWKAYGWAAQDLLEQGRTQEAVLTIDKGLQKLPDHLSLLTIATDVYRYAGDFSKALSLGRKLIKRHPNAWQGYARVAKDLLGTKRLDEAHAVVMQGINEIHRDNYEKYPAKKRLWIDSLASKLNIQSDLSTLILNDDVIPIRYWSQGEPPSEFNDIAELWNLLFLEIGVSSIETYDKVAAGRWIAQHAPELERPFSTAHHYAIEADVFRIAYGSKCRSLYLDCDLYPTSASKAILTSALKSGWTTLYFRTMMPFVCNCFFITADNCPFFKRLALAVGKIDFSLLPRDLAFYDLVGPGLFNKSVDQMFSNRETNLTKPSALPGALARTGNDATNLGFVCELFAAEHSPPYTLHNVTGYSRWQYLF